jgi:enamine deaminase RidA (YjgF/YER057c/UK114 family)
MPRTSHQPPELFNSRPWGFSQVVVSPPGKLVHIGGQVAWDANERTLARTRREQLVVVLNHLEIAVRSVGGTLDDVQSLRLYMPNFIAGTEADMVAEVLTATFGTENPPASTWLGVQSLAQPEYLVEVEAFAVIGGGEGS